MILIVAVLIVFLLSLSGCILGPIAAQKLSPEQIEALQKYNDQGDVYACFAINGPPPGGNLMVILVPKGVKPTLQYSPDCQIISGGVNANR